MFRIPDYYDNLSQISSEVFNDIGVNEKLILKRRHAVLLNETMETITFNTILTQSTYYFGSYSEGTTTEGLNSDTDILFGMNTFIVIQDYDEWQHGFENLLMTKDENTPPGYCQLQVLQSDLPLPATCVVNEHRVKVSSDKVLLKNTLLTSRDYEKHGPSWIIQGRPGVTDEDHVPAFPCKSWPKEGKQCLQMRSTHKWPTQEMKKFAEKSTCFVVSVGSKVSHNETVEWRISTSLAERCLMFSLNITQIRCCILMKMIIKTYFKSQGEDHLSSFMCKTVLFYCIQNTHPNLWKEFNLLKCLICCLQRLYTCLIGKNCPHFFIPGNNLMAGKFSVQVKRKLQDKLYHIMGNIRQTLFGIHIDDIGTRLQIKLNQLHNPVQSLSTANYEMLLKTSSKYFWNLTSTICIMTGQIIQRSTNHDTSGQVQQYLLRDIHRYTTLYRDGNTLEQTAISLQVRPICSLLGTIIASSNLQTNNHVSSEAFDLLKCGVNFDVSSGRLKLASVLYCLGDMIGTEVILTDIQRGYNFQSTEPVCYCYEIIKHTMREQFAEEVHMKGILQGMKENTAFCVRFTPAEINCIPHELQYEMFRSNKEDLLYRNMKMDYWMDWAVVDSLPYLYFLQYKTYGQLQRYDDQQKALLYLILYIQKENLPGHRETALNLLGQCMEQENRIQDAMFCYYNSLTIRNRNNVAKIHICRLIANLIRNQNMQ